MKKLLKRARKLFGRTAFAGCLCFVVWVSIQLVLSTMRPPDSVVPEGTMLAGDIVCLLFQAAILIAIVYHDAWRWGDKDRNAANFGRISPRPWHGFTIGLLANIPSLLTFLILLLDKLVGLWDFYIIIYRFFHMALYPVVSWGLTRHMDMGLESLSWGNVWLAGIPVLVLPVLTAISYRLGYAQFVISDRLIYENKKKSK